MTPPLRNGTTTAAAATSIGRAAAPQQPPVDEEKDEADMWKRIVEKRCRDCQSLDPSVLRAILVEEQQRSPEATSSVEGAAPEQLLAAATQKTLLRQIQYRLWHHVKICAAEEDELNEDATRRRRASWKALQALFRSIDAEKGKQKQRQAAAASVAGAVSTTATTQEEERSTSIPQRQQEEPRASPLHDDTSTNKNAASIKNAQAAAAAAAASPPSSAEGYPSSEDDGFTLTEIAQQHNSPRGGLAGTGGGVSHPKPNGQGTNSHPSTSSNNHQKDATTASQKTATAPDSASLDGLLLQFGQQAAVSPSNGIVDPKNTPGKAAPHQSRTNPPPPNGNGAVVRKRPPIRPPARRRPSLETTTATGITETTTTTSHDNPAVQRVVTTESSPESGGSQKSTTTNRTQSATGGSSYPCLTPGENDVLTAGSSSELDHHPGNVRYREMIRQLAAEYHRTETNRSALVRTVNAKVAELDGRFLERDAAGKQWILMDAKRAEHKTNHALLHEHEESNSGGAGAGRSRQEAAAYDGNASEKTTNGIVAPPMMPQMGLGSTSLSASTSQQHQQDESSTSMQHDEQEEASTEAGELSAAASQHEPVFGDPMPRDLATKLGKAVNKNCRFLVKGKQDKIWRCRLCPSAKHLHENNLKSHCSGKKHIENREKAAKNKKKKQNGRSIIQVSHSNQQQQPPLAVANRTARSERRGSVEPASAVPAAASALAPAGAGPRGFSLMPAWMTRAQQPHPDPGPENPRAAANPSTQRTVSVAGAGGGGVAASLQPQPQDMQHRPPGAPVAAATVATNGLASRWQPPGSFDQRPRAGILKPSTIKPSSIITRPRVAQGVRNISTILLKHDRRPTLAGTVKERAPTRATFTATPIDNTLTRMFGMRLKEWDPFWTPIAEVASGVTSKVHHLHPRTHLIYNAMDEDFSFVEGSPLVEMFQWGQQRGTGAWQNDEVVLLLRMLPVNLDSYSKKRADCHLWPKGTYLQINDTPVRLEQRRQQAHDEREWKGMSREVSIAEFVTDPTKINKVQLCCYDAEPFFYSLSVCQYTSAESIYSSMIDPTDPKAITCVSVQSGKERAIDFAARQMTVTIDSDAEEDDEDVGKFVFSLTCPISRQLMEFPVRGKSCKHWQCFDLRNFIQSNAHVSGSRWRCASCEDFVSLQNLEFCGLTGSLLEEFKGQASVDRDRVEFSADGRYRLLEERKRRHAGQKREPDAAASAAVAAPSNKRAKPSSPEIIEIL